jgi:hypothetical protein
MQIQQLNRTDAETVNIIVKNVDGGGSITTGLGATMLVGAASIDGIGVVKDAAAGRKAFVGVAVDDIPINGYGRLRAWGLCNSVLVSNEGSSVTVTAGDVLIPSAVAGQFTSGVTNQAASTVMYRYVMAGQTLTHSAATYIKGIVYGL